MAYLSVLDTVIRIFLKECSRCRPSHRQRSRGVIPSRSTLVGRFLVALAVYSSPSSSHCLVSESLQVRLRNVPTPTILLPYLSSPHPSAAHPICSNAFVGSLFTSARVVYAAARMGQLPRALGVLDARHGTPIRAVLLQATLTIALIFFGGGFRRLVRIAVVALWAFYFLTVRRATLSHKPYMLNWCLGFGCTDTLRARAGPSSVCIFCLAHRCGFFDIINHENRPYRTWIITPLIFCAVCSARYTSRSLLSYV